jgi:hypothetical protein
MKRRIPGSEPYICTDQSALFEVRESFGISSSISAGYRLASPEEQEVFKKFQKRVAQLRKEHLGRPAELTSRNPLRADRVRLASERLKRYALSLYETVDSVFVFAAVRLS